MLYWLGYKENTLFISISSTDLPFRLQQQQLKKKITTINFVLQASPAHHRHCFLFLAFFPFLSITLSN